MKKLILLVFMIFMLSSICQAEEFLSLNSENISLTIDKYTLLGIGIYFGFCLLTIAIIIGMYINYINNKCLIKVNSMEIFKKRLALGKIPYRDLRFIKKSFCELDSNTPKQTNENSKQSVSNTIPEKCSNKS